MVTRNIRARHRVTCAYSARLLRPITYGASNEPEAGWLVNGSSEDGEVCKLLGHFRLQQYRRERVPSLPLTRGTLRSKSPPKTDVNAADIFFVVSSSLIVTGKRERT